MNADSRGGKRFHDDMLKPKRRPRLALPILVVAREYKKQVAAALKARRELVAEVVKRTDGREAALETLCLVAKEFGLTPFTNADIDYLEMDG